jgi:hypothetical protein
VSKLAEFFKNPGSWTKNAYARNAYFEIVPIKSLQAKKFCIVGGLCRVYECHPLDINSLPEYQKLLEFMRKKYNVKYYDIDFINDFIIQKREEVVNICEEAGV